MSTSSADLLGLRAHFGSPMNRIQKLLLSDEYATFDDTVLVESPFAQVTADGIGLRQVQLGLSPTRLLIAADVFGSVSNPLQRCYNVDPEINTLEMVSIIPVELCSIRVSRRKEQDRHMLNVVLSGGHQMWFEFGGFVYRKFYWDWWQDRIDALRHSHNRPACTDYLSHHASNALSTTNQSAYIDVHREPDWTTPPRSTTTSASRDTTHLEETVISSNSSTALLMATDFAGALGNNKRVSSKSSNESWIYQQLEDITKIFKLGRKKR